MNLRVSPTTLVGRDRELAALEDALQRGARTLVLKGPPGVGKSSLARAFADRARRHRDRPSRVIELSLSHTTERATAITALATALGLDVRTSDANVAFERVTRALDEAPHTIVIDDLDASPQVASVVEDLVAAVDSVCLLLCSGRWLTVGAELVIDVAPLSEPDAAQLLFSRVNRLSPSLSLSREACASIAARVDRLPLGIELLAAKVAAIGPAPVLDALEDGRLVLDGLERSIATAFEALPEDARRALVALSTFRSPFDVEAASAVMGSLGEDGTGSITVLEQLVRASLLVADVRGEGSRFSMLDSIREFAGRRATDEHRAKHCAYFGRDAAPRGDDPAVWSALARDHADLDAAWSWATSADRAPSRTRAILAANVALRLDVILVARGQFERHQHVIDTTTAMLSADPSAVVDPTLTIEFAIARGRAFALHGRLRESLAPYREGLEAAMKHGEAARVALSRASLCFVLAPLGEFDEARAFGEAALVDAARLRSHRLSATAEQALGIVEYHRGDQDRAVEHFERALASAMAASAPRLVGIVQANYALAEAKRGNAREALRRNALARASFELAKDRFHLCRLTVLEAKYLAQLDELDRAEELLPSALDEAILLSDLSGELEARATLALLAQRRSDGADDGLYRARMAALEAAARFSDDRAWPRRIAELRAGERRTPSGTPTAVTTAATLALTRDGRLLSINGAQFDLSKRGPLRKILVALVRARIDEGGRSLDASEVRAAGWPGEKMLPESAAARVYMAISRLRALGLEALLRTSDEGYSLDSRASVRWLEG